MTPLPLPSPADAWWCPTCQIHRTSTPTRLCPVCADHERLANRPRPQEGAVKVTVTHDDGTTVDITEGVQVAFDAVIGSLDWGSGMLDAEEEDAIVALAAACRFPDFQEIADSVRRERERVAKVQEERDRRFAEAQRAGLDAKQREHLRGKGLWIP